MHQRVVRPLHGELVGCADEGQAGEGGDLGRGRRRKTRRRVDAGADRRAAERQAIDAAQRLLDALAVVAQHAGVAGPFLSQGERRRILHVGAANLDDVPPGIRLGGDGVAQLVDGRQQPRRHGDRNGDVHRRGKRVVRRLRHVHVIVRMHRRLAAERLAGELRAAVGDDLVDVHVELRAAAAHPDMQRKHVLMPTGQDFVANRDDQPLRLVTQPSAGVIGARGGLLQRRIGSDHFPRHQLPADAEMFERALRLGTPEPVGRHFDDAHAVGLAATVAHPLCSPVTALRIESAVVYGNKTT